MVNSASGPRYEVTSVQPKNPPFSNFFFPLGPPFWDPWLQTHCPSLYLYLTPIQSDYVSLCLNPLPTTTRLKNPWICVCFLGTGTVLSARVCVCVWVVRYEPLNHCFPAWSRELPFEVVGRSQDSEYVTILLTRLGMKVNQHELLDDFWSLLGFRQKRVRAQKECGMWSSCLRLTDFFASSSAL